MNKWHWLLIWMILIAACVAWWSNAMWLRREKKREKRLRDKHRQRRGNGWQTDPHNPLEPPTETDAQDPRSGTIFGEHNAKGKR